MRMLSTNQVIDITGLSRSTIQRLEKARRFPSRRRISYRRISYVYSEISDWLNSREKMVNGEQSDLTLEIHEKEIHHEKN